MYQIKLFNLKYCISSIYLSIISYDDITNQQYNAVIWICYVMPDP